MKNSSVIVALGIAIPLIATVILIILMSNSGNLVKTDYSLLYTVNSGQCGNKGYVIDHSSEKLMETEVKPCYNYQAQPETSQNDELYVVNPTKNTVTKIDFATASNFKIKAGNTSPDGVKYQSLSYYRYGNDFGELLTLGLSRRNDYGLSLELEKGPWSREIDLIAPGNYQYYGNLNVLGWILED